MLDLCCNILLSYGMDVQNKIKKKNKKKKTKKKNALEVLQNEAARIDRPVL